MSPAVAEGTVPAAPACVAARLARATERLASSGIDTARLEAEDLLAHALGCERLDLYVNRGRELSSSESARYDGLITRRATREPLQYVRGHAHFYGRAFQADSRVLVPRLETEILVARALEILGSHAAPRALDLGTGSGCIGLSIAAELPDARVTATDSDAAALEVARANAGALGVSSRVDFREGDLFDALGGDEAPFDLIAMNPPYVTESERARIAPEVREWEPARALYVPDDEPLLFYERLAARVRSFLAPGGAVLVEAGAGRAQGVADLFSNAGLTEIRTREDIRGIERVVEARRKSG